MGTVLIVTKKCFDDSHVYLYEVTLIWGSNNQEYVSTLATTCTLLSRHVHEILSRKERDRGSGYMYVMYTMHVHVVCFTTIYSLVQTTQCTYLPSVVTTT